MKNKNSKHASSVPTPALTRAIKHLLRPLVGLLLDNGLTYSWLTKVLKVIYVDVAETEFSLQNKKQTDSRISLLTGVHRKDVRRIRSEGNDNFDPPSSIFLGAKLVAIWTTEPRFLDALGKPAPLARLPSTAQEKQLVSFEQLVTLVSKDIRPRAILDEWLRLGSVSINEQDEVCLKVEAFIPAKGFDEKVYYLGKNIHDHMSAARDNVQSEDPPFLERSVYYDMLTTDSANQLETLSEKKAMEMLKYLNTHARKLQQKDKSKEHADRRMNLGVYFYSDKNK